MAVGVADTIVFHLDNNVVPVITYVETPLVEISGAFEIKFVAFDLERDLSYRYRYWFDSVWGDADVEYVGSVGDRVVVV